MTGDDRTDGDHRINLLGPLGPASRLIRRSEVQVGLLDGGFLLVDTHSALACVLDDHAAGLWFSCEGQSFAEITNTAVAAGEATAREITELFRVLRLLGMIEDAEPTVEPDRDSRADLSALWSAYPRAEEFHFRGELRVTTAGREAIISHSEQPADGPDTDTCSLSLRTDGHSGVDGSTLVVLIDPSTPAEQELEGIEALVALVRTSPDTPIEVLTRLVEHCSIRRRPT